MDYKHKSGDIAPLPNDLPLSAPIINDVERGCAVLQEKQSEVSGLEHPSKEESMPRKERRSKGLTEGDQDMPDLPKNNLLIVMPCIGLVLFLAALDQTIVATALPTIADIFDATPSEYSWVATSYQLAMTLLTPVNGRVSDIIGRKPMLYAAIVEFTVFSALCGAAKSMRWLIICRAFQGLGGGSIIGLCSIVVSDIVPLEKRGVYQGFMGASWGIAAVVGPIVGGVLTEKASWRWCFYINLPTCGIAFILLVCTLKLNPTKKYTFSMLCKTFDFIGLFLVMVGGSLTIVGFSIAADDGFGKPAAIALIVIGIATFLSAIVNCIFTKRTAVIPARIFKVRTTLFFLIGSTLHAAAFIPTNWLLPQFFQGVRGADALQSGIQLLPFACFVAWTTVIAGQIQSRLRIVRPTVWVGYAFGALGYGLLYAFFTSTIPYARQCGLLIIPAIGAGLSLQSPLLIMQAAMPLKEMAAVTSAWVLTRSLGGSVGIAVFTAVLNTGLRSRFEKIPGYGSEFTVPTSASGYSALHDLPDGPTKDAVLAAFADSFKPCWMATVVLFLISLSLTVWTRSYSLRRTRGPAAITTEVTETEEGGSVAEALQPAQFDNALPIDGDKSKDIEDDDPKSHTT